MKLRTKLILFLVAISILPFVPVIILVFFGGITTHMETAAARQLEVAAFAERDAIEAIVGYYEFEARAAVSAPTLLSLAAFAISRANPAASELLRMKLTSVIGGDIVRISLFDHSGRIVMTVPNLPSVTAAFGPMRSVDFVRSGRTIHALFTVPFEGGGYFRITTAADRLSRLVAQRSHGRSAPIVGIGVARGIASVERLAGVSVDMPLPSHETVRRFIHWLSIVRTHNDDLFFYRDGSIPGQLPEHVIGFAPKSRLLYTLSMPSGTAFGIAEKIETSFAAMLVLVLFGIYLTVNYVSRSVTRPVTNLNDAIDGIIDHSNFETRLVVRTHDEIGSLAASFNRMSETLAGTSVEFTERIGELNREIEEKVRAQVELNESEERFKMLAESTLEGVALYRSGCIIDANDTFARLFGYETAEVAGRDIMSFIAPASYERARVYVSMGYERPYEARCLRKDGSTFDAELCQRTIPYRGELVRVVTVRDVSEHKLTAKALRASDGRFRAIFERIRVGIVICDMERKIVSSNPAVESILGYARDELYGKKIADFLPVEEIEPFDRAQQEMIEGASGYYTAEKRFIRSDGSIVWTQLTSTLISDQYGSPQYLVKMIEEITDRKKAERTLVESERRFREILENVPLVALIIDTAGRTTFCNRYLCDLSGWKFDELIGTDVFELLFPESSRGEMAHRHEEAMRTGAMQSHFESRIMLKDGSLRTIGWSATIMTDVKGEISGTTSLGLDITERVGIQRKIEEQRQVFKSSAIIGDALARTKAIPEMLKLCASSLTSDLGAVSSHIWVVEGESGLCDLVASSGKGQASAGEYGRAEMSYEVVERIAAQRSPLVIDTTDEIDFIDRAWMARYGIVAFTGYPLIVEDELVGVMTLTWGKRIDEVVVSALGPIAGTVAIGIKRKQAEFEILLRQIELEDINETLENRIAEEVGKNREKDHLLIQQGRLAAMGEMIGNIAHQWRQPLNAIGLIIQNIQDTYEFNKLDTDYLQKTVRQGMDIVKLMSRTIDDFRNYFKPEKDKIPFDVIANVRRTIGFVETAYRSHGIELTLVAERSITIIGYPNEYSQALLNILNNARDVLIERKVPAPKVRIVVVESEGHSIVTIEDNAGGIAPEISDRIFDPYFTTKEDGTGTGIGLYMSKNIIEKNMGGSLRFHNGTVGAVFTIEI